MLLSETQLAESGWEEEDIFVMTDLDSVILFMHSPNPHSRGFLYL
jgi:hypothetical protein